MVRIANAIGTIYALLAVVAVPEPQAFAGLGLVALLMVLSLLRDPYNGGPDA